MSLPNQPIDILLWWKIYQSILKNKSLVRPLFFLDELGEEHEGELFYDQVIFLNLKSYLYNSTFIIDKIGKDLKRLIIIFKRFLKFIKTKFQKAITSGARQRVLARLPFRELNSIFWILTQCKAYTSYVDMTWKSVRRDTDPFYIKANSGILRHNVSISGVSKGPLMLCLQRIEQFIKKTESFTLQERLELLHFHIIESEPEPEPESEQESVSNSELDSFFYFFL